VFPPVNLRKKLLPRLLFTASRFLRGQGPPGATREQVENFVGHLADGAEKDRNALLCQLNSYLGTKKSCSMRRRFQGLGDISARLERASTGGIEHIKSFDEFLERRFPESRR
jgi:hypothetical protein